MSMIKASAINVQHIASFSGNIGDNASHIGFNHILQQTMPCHRIHREEIRQYYKNYDGPHKKQFDRQFVDAVNHADITVIGGGGFLDYWVKDSQSGTTVDIAPELLKEIKKPLIITSVGCSPNHTVPDENLGKFRHFLDEALDNPLIKIAVRNDGSKYSLLKDIGKHYSQALPEIADNGFFYNSDCNHDNFIEHDYICINIAKDQILMTQSFGQGIDPQVFLKKIANLVRFLVEDKKLHIVLVPHIYQDLEIISSLISVLPQYIVRNYLHIAPCSQGDKGCITTFNIYKMSRLVIGMRYHANVCPIAMNVPTLGLVALNRVKYVYDQLELTDRYVRIDQLNSPELEQKVSALLSDTNSYTHARYQLENLKRDSLNWYSKTIHQLLNL